MIRARLQAGLSQTQVCQSLGLAQSTLQSAETSTQGSNDTARYAALYNVSALWLTDGTGQMTDNTSATSLHENGAFSVRLAKSVVSPEQFAIGISEAFAELARSAAKDRSEELLDLLSAWAKSGFKPSYLPIMVEIMTAQVEPT